MTGIAERDRTKTPVAAEALIVTSGSLFFHRIAPGGPLPQPPAAPRPSPLPFQAAPGRVSSARPRRPQLPRAHRGSSRVR